jgi:hypothetical protein
MMNLVILIAIPLALLILLIAAFRRGSTDLPSAYPDFADHAPRLPNPALLEQCLSVDDLNFVKCLNSRRVLRLLLHERRRLAREWLRLMRRESVRLFRLHVHMVRHSEELRPSVEFRLGVSVATFFIVYGAMVAVVSLYGPVRTRTLLDSLHYLGNILSNCGGRIAAVTSPRWHAAARAH